MSEQNKIYWKGLEELTNEPSFVANADKEFASVPPSASSNTLDGLTGQRRDFLKVMGFGMAAVSLAACETPIKKAIPFLNKPEEYDPSIANYYASSYSDGHDYCAILVKTREGRPIKIEGNKLSSVTQGGTSARVQASILSLYDTERFKAPTIRKKATTWPAFDKEVGEKLAEIAGANGRIAFVTNSIISPSFKQALAAWTAKYPSTNIVVYDPMSASGILNANKASFGKQVVPSYYFNKAEVIVSFGADFLGTWLSPTEYAKQFAIGRKPTADRPQMSRLFSFEANLSLTGSNADYRAPIKPSAEGVYVAALYNAVASALGRATISGGAITAHKEIVAQAAKDLVAASGKSLVISGSNDVNIQLLVNGINELLGNYGKTIDLNTALLTRQGQDADLAAFVLAAKTGGVQAVIFNDCNPVYDSALGAELKAALASVPLKVAIASRPDETTEASDYIAAAHHYLESWGDAEPRTGYYSLTQPTITKIFDTRQALETVLLWCGNGADPYKYVSSYWSNNFYPKQDNYGSFRDFWNYSLHDGIFEIGAPSARAASAGAVKDSTGNIVMPASAVVGPFERASAHTASFGGSVSGAASAVEASYSATSAGTDLVMYESMGLGVGRDANNPWLQEFSDPITRACWDNYITIPQSLAKSWGDFKINEGDSILATLKVGGVTLKVPVLVQPGQAKGTIGLALGYGREVAGKAGKGIGVNAHKFLSLANGGVKYHVTGVTVEKTDEKYRIAHVQTHHTIMGRDIVQGSTLNEWKKNPAAGRHIVEVTTGDKGHVPATDMTMWPTIPRPNHSWGMVVDMNSCIGCGACTVACQVENNVPVVGKEEVLNRREMHWIRIDRYYSSVYKEGDDQHLMEEAAENPQVVFQPLMCQHCNNAPCETVCPVAATTHSNEGLNQMTYNRCIGTRYCANNCPYKVRRFNWFSYPQNAENFPLNFPTLSDLGRMVLNPDVTVRARGVMEKCSMCVQRLQEVKLNARKENRRPIDGEIITACAAACSSGAIIFGDMNDAESKIAQLMNVESGKRNYQLLSEINTNPSVSYLTKIRNTADKA